MFINAFTYRPAPSKVAVYIVDSRTATRVARTQGTWKNGTSRWGTKSEHHIIFNAIKEHVHIAGRGK